MVGVDLPLLLILLCGDVETNPGPLAPLARGPNLEKVSPRICHGWNKPLEASDVRTQSREDKLHIIEKQERDPIFGNVRKMTMI